MVYLLFGDCVYGTTRLNTVILKKIKTSMQGKIVHERATCEPLNIFKLEECGPEGLLNQSTWKGMLLNGCVTLTSDSSSSSYLVGISTENLVHACKCICITQGRFTRRILHKNSIFKKSSLEHWSIQLYCKFSLLASRPKSGASRQELVTFSCVPLFTVSCHMLIPASLGTATEILTDGYYTDTFSFVVITTLV